MNRAWLLMYVLGSGIAYAAVSFQPTGTGVLTFDASPGATDWSTRSIPGSSGSIIMGLILGVSQPTSSCVPALSIVRASASTVTLNWTCGGILQVAHLLGGPPEFWYDVITTTNSITTNLNYRTMYFRVRP